MDFVDRQTVSGGGICVREPTEPHTSCNDHFHTSFALDSRWRYFHITASCLVQQGFGMQFDEVKMDELKTLHFIVLGPRAFSIWIDDVAFYR
ncbi:hypothetical protein WME89_08850 [Sorangium sp. So ce321]|uniref:hypothetical protein n=1 Tax=Sorangium sp. So ce321 TaxID=3133300 RepID=UPI003F60F55C